MSGPVAFKAGVGGYAEITFTAITNGTIDYLTKLLNDYGLAAEGKYAGAYIDRATITITQLTGVGKIEPLVITTKLRSPNVLIIPVNLLVLLDNMKMLDAFKTELFNAGASEVKDYDKIPPPKFVGSIGGAGGGGMAGGYRRRRGSRKSGRKSRKSKRRSSRKNRKSGRKTRSNRS